jgi:hypothetical protein
MGGVHMKLRAILAAACMGGLALTACVDLEVINPNDPDAERALGTPGDVEALIGGSWEHWWNSGYASNSAGPVLATLAYQHSATAANFGMVEFSGWPKVPVHHLTANVYYDQFANNWVWQFRAVAAAVDGLTALESGEIDLPADRLSRATAFGYFVLGLAHAGAATMYDQAYIFDPSIDPNEVALHPYPDVMAAAMGYFDQALAALPGADDFPETWMSREVSEDEMRRMIHSYKARYRAAVARTPAERAAVDWAAVIADVNAGITEDWSVDVQSSTGFSSGALVNMPRYGPWGQLSYQVLGMADQSGNYQEWIERDPFDRHPNLSADQTGDPFLIMTPDLRFPQGATIEAQTANDGVLFEIPTASGGFGAQWNRPDRGPFRWSYYRYLGNNMWLETSANRTQGQKEMTVNEMRLLQAEAHLHMNNPGAAATLINVTREAAGLNATDAAGTNTSCVPKLPDGTCGDLFEMMKWEVRLETMYQGLHLAPWYFHGRGWGDLAEGTFLQMPLPGREAELLFIQPYTFGGPGLDSSAPVGTYGY